MSDQSEIDPKSFFSKLAFDSLVGSLFIFVEMVGAFGIVRCKYDRSALSTEITTNDSKNNLSTLPTTWCF